tara:strand:+ start:705 stop:848 length:144 start_codon:yes stop_codon:yes gene_type:complete
MAKGKITKALGGYAEAHPVWMAAVSAALGAGVAAAVRYALQMKLSLR